MTENEKLDYLLGQVHALTAALQMVLLVHPERSRLLEVIDKAVDRIEGNALRLELSDVHVGGISETRKVLHQTESIAKESLKSRQST